MFIIRLWMENVILNALHIHMYVCMCVCLNTLKHFLTLKGIPLNILDAISHMLQMSKCPNDRTLSNLQRIIFRPLDQYGTSKIIFFYFFRDADNGMTTFRNALKVLDFVCLFLD